MPSFYIPKENGIIKKIHFYIPFSLKDSIKYDLYSSVTESNSLISHNK